MRLAHLAAGAAGMFCGACKRDITLVRGLTQLGVDVEVLPLYTPLRDDGPEDLETGPIFLGGINAYLQQNSPLFRRTPRWLDSLLDNETLLRWVSRFAIRTSASDLGPMTVSVLKGRDGLQRKEFDRLLRYLIDLSRPDIVSITNTLLSAVAPVIRERMRVPVVAALQGEESFVDGLPDPFGVAARDLLRRNVQCIDRLLAPGAAYADSMAEFLDYPRDRIDVVRVGITGSTVEVIPRPQREALEIVYLGAILRAKGLDLLVAALGEAAASMRRPVHLSVAGRVVDAEYWRHVEPALNQLPATVSVSVYGEVDGEQKRLLLEDADLVVTPSRVTESRGIVALEALSRGAAVLAPAQGAFLEMATLTGGVALVTPDDAGEMARGLVELASHRGRLAAMGVAGASGVCAHYSAARMVEQTQRVMERLVAERQAGL